jgi:hypothetical protein
MHPNTHLGSSTTSCLAETDLEMLHFSYKPGACRPEVEEEEVCNEGGACNAGGVGKADVVSKVDVCSAEVCSAEDLRAAADGVGGTLMPEEDKLVPPAGVCACKGGALWAKGDVGIGTWDWRKGDDGRVLDSEA